MDILKSVVVEKTKMDGIAKVISADDNVANMMGCGKKGQRVTCIIEDQIEVVVRLTEDIPANHKFALRDIGSGDPVVKYGFPIGTASRNIRKGEYVHIHNVESNRGRGDLAKVPTDHPQQMEEIQCL